MNQILLSYEKSGHQDSLWERGFGKFGNCGLLNKREGHAQKIRVSGYTL